MSEAMLQYAQFQQPFRNWAANVSVARATAPEDK